MVRFLAANLFPLLIRMQCTELCALELNYIKKHILLITIIIELVYHNSISLCIKSIIFPYISPCLLNYLSLYPIYFSNPVNHFQSPLTQYLYYQVLEHFQCHLVSLSAPPFNSATPATASVPLCSQSRPWQGAAGRRCL